MRWFKHLVKSGDDPDVGAIMSKFGFRGYYLFFRTIEIMAEEFDVKKPGKNTFDFPWFLDRFPRNISKKTLLEFLRFCQTSLHKRRIIHKLNGNTIFLNCPKLKDLADEYTLKLIGSKSRQESGVNPEPTLEHRNRSKNIEERRKIIKYFNSISGQNRTFSCQETNKLISGRLSEGRTFENFKHVIDTKTSQWLNDSKMRKFLRPSTLFKPGNFEDYLNESYEDPKKVKARIENKDKFKNIPTTIIQ